MSHFLSNKHADNIQTNDGRNEIRSPYLLFGDQVVEKNPAQESNL